MPTRAKADEGSTNPNDDPCAKPLVTISDHYHPFPRQREFHESPAKYRLFGGAAGPGKTKALLWEAIRQANHYDRVDTLLLRRTFPELESSLINYFRRDVPRDIYKSYNDTKHVVTWHNGSTTRFGYSAGESDIFQYQGAEFLFIGIDELTLFTLGQWQFLTSRNRCAVPGTFPNMAGASNPGNIGHAWVKALWVDRRPAPGMDRADQYDPGDYAFIRATLADNPIYKDDFAYRKALDALPRHMRQAFLEGDWNVYAGQYFDIFDLRLHTARAEQIGRDPRGNYSGGDRGDGRRDDGIAPWWPRWISIDWGFEHPSAVYWHAADPAGGIVTYREFVANHLSPRMLAQAIAERSRGFNIAERSRGCNIAERSRGFDVVERSSGASVAQSVPRATAEPYRTTSLRGEPDAFYETSARLDRRGSRNDETQSDYGGDAFIHDARGPRPQVSARIEAAGAHDPTSRAIWAQKFMAEERRARRGQPLPHRW